MADVTMADDLNRALQRRVTEILADVKVEETKTLAVRNQITLAERPGFIIAGQAIVRVQALANAPQPYIPKSTDDPETVQTGLRKNMLDASVKRLMCYRSMQNAEAALQWHLQRTQLLQGKQPTPQDQPALQALDQTLNQTLGAITFHKGYRDLRTQDEQRGYWLDDDPTLEEIEDAIENM